MDNDRELFERWFKEVLINQHKLTEQEANTYLKYTNAIGYVHHNTASRYEGYQAALSHSKERIAELEKDAERYRKLKSLMGDVVADISVTYFAGVDWHTVHDAETLNSVIDAAMEESE